MTIPEPTLVWFAVAAVIATFTEALKRRWGA